MCYGGVGQSVRVDPKADTSRGAVLDLQTRELCLGAVNSREGLSKGVVVRAATIRVSATEGEMSEQHWARWSSDCGWQRREWGRWSLKKHRAWRAAVISQERRVSRWTWVDDPRNYTVKQVLWFTVGLDGQALTQVSRRPGDDCTPVLSIATGIHSRSGQQVRRWGLCSEVETTALQKNTGTHLDHDTKQERLTPVFASFLSYD